MHVINKFNYIKKAYKFIEKIRKKVWVVVSVDFSGNGCVVNKTLLQIRYFQFKKYKRQIFSFREHF